MDSPQNFLRIAVLKEKVKKLKCTLLLKHLSICQPKKTEKAGS